MRKPFLLAGVLLCVLQSPAFARGVSPYLPVNLEPEMERQIEQVLVLAGQPILTRPIAAARVFDALPKACEIDGELCASVERYLRRYMDNSGISHASIAGAVTSGDDQPVPNRHGLGVDSAYEVSARVYWQPLDHALISLGGVAYDGEATPTGSLLSLGWDWFQIDAGYRDHWFSPMTDSAMLVSTEAATMQSVTISNYKPITRFGIRYEAFMAEMSESDEILADGQQTVGKPRIAGLHLAIEPATGWSLGLNRILQYGGGGRGNPSFKDVWKAFFKPSDFDNVNDPTTQEQFGNQLASITSRFIFPGSVPFSVYAEYAGEDTSRGRDYLLGNSALSFGLDFPRLGERFDLTYELSEWQNGWYVNGIYGDGLTNEGRIIGHWGGDNRQFRDEIGAQTHMLRLGWTPSFGGVFEFKYRTIANESYGTVDYERGHDFTVRYSRSLDEFTVGGEVYAGRDVFGEDVSRIGAFVRYSPDIRKSSLFASTSSAKPKRADGAELFVDVGINASEVKIDLDTGIPIETTDAEVAPHIGLGARRKISASQDLGVRIEIDEVNSELLLGVRAVDYRYRFGKHLAVSGFLGAARYDLATPAYGVYLGAGAQWRDILPGWDVGLDLRYAEKVARDDLLPEDVPGGRPDSFYDITGASLYISRKF